eukprot:6066585-Karenia_brevis.AAC.1
MKNGAWANRSNHCLYCKKVVRGVYAPRYTMSGVALMIGKDNEENAKFYGFREFAVETVKTAQDPQAHISWSQGKKKLEGLLDTSTVWEAPKD